MKYITTPIYYVNAEPHIGGAYTTLAADVLARYWRIRGEEVFFLTGTDEHGAKIAEAAEKAGKDPQSFTDEIAAIFEKTWDTLDIRTDGFIRTTNPKHKAFVQQFLQKLYDAGYIVKGQYTGWYCTGCEEFKTETQIGPGNTCPLHLKPLIEVSEESYLFDLPKFERQILEAIKSDTFKIRPLSRKNEVIAFIEKEGLREIAISRKNVAWGVSVPWDSSHTVYVWVDALLNYLSAHDPSGPVFLSAKKPTWPPTTQFIGKDILRFHAVIWPGILLASGYDLPKELFVNGFLTLNGQKISKSLGNVVTPQELIDRYGVDGARYLLVSAVPLGADGDISFERFDALYQSDLANTIGNLVNRIQAMLQRYRDGVVPLAPRELPLQHLVKTRQALDEAWEATDLGKVVELLRLHTAHFNSYIEQSKPWELNKTNQEELDFVLAHLAENVYVLAIFLAPFMPRAAERILSIFGSSIAEVEYATLGVTNHTAGKTIAAIDPLFPRREE